MLVCGDDILRVGRAEPFALTTRDVAKPHWLTDRLTRSPADRLQLLADEFSRSEG